MLVIFTHNNPNIVCKLNSLNELPLISYSLRLKELKKVLKSIQKVPFDNSFAVVNLKQFYTYYMTKQMSTYIDVVREISILGHMSGSVG